MNGLKHQLEVSQMVLKIWKLLLWNYSEYDHCLHDFLFTNHTFLDTYALYSSVYAIILDDLYRKSITYVEHVLFFYMHFLLSHWLSFPLSNVVVLKCIFYCTLFIF